MTTTAASKKNGEAVESQQLVQRRTEPAQTMIEVASSRAAQEVQAAMVVAKKFPRDTIMAENRILEACQRVRLAESALYSYPRGGTQIEGESIRLAEVYAQCWGNVESGVVELSRGDGESVAMAYCMDLETNARDVKVFTVKHIRDRSERKGGNVALIDERDIYELVANMGSRRKRACILSIIPIDIREAAVAQCRKTMEGDKTVPLIDRVKQMVQAFEPLGVNLTMIQQRLGHNLQATTPRELVTLRGIFASLRDQMSKVDDWFGPAPTEDPSVGGVEGLKARMAAEKQPPTQETPTATTTPTEADPLDAVSIAQPQAEVPPPELGLFKGWRCKGDDCGKTFDQPRKVATGKKKGTLICPECLSENIEEIK